MKFTIRDHVSLQKVFYIFAFSLLHLQWHGMCRTIQGRDPKSGLVLVTWSYIPFSFNSYIPLLEGMLEITPSTTIDWTCVQLQRKEAQWMMNKKFDPLSLNSPIKSSYFLSVTMAFIFFKAKITTYLEKHSYLLCTYINKHTYL